MALAILLHGTNTLYVDETKNNLLNELLPSSEIVHHCEGLKEVAVKENKELGRIKIEFEKGDERITITHLGAYTKWEAKTDKKHAQYGAYA